MIRPALITISCILTLTGVALAVEETAFDRAFDLYSRGKYKEAEAEYRKAIEESPDSVGANLELGRLLREQGRVDDALPFLQTAFELAPSLASAASELGTAYLALKDWDKAVEVLTKAARLDARDAYTWWRLGTAHAEKEDAKGAEKALNRSVGLDPDLAMAWLELGKLHRKAEDGSKAITCFQRASEADPWSTEAFKHFAEAVKDFGDDAQKTYVEALSEHNAEKFGDAERKARKLLEEDAENARFRILLGHILIHQTPAKHEEAIAEYEQGLALDKKAPRKDRLPSASRSFALEGLGIASLLAKDLKKAKAVFTEGTKTDEEYAGHHYYLAVVAARGAKISEVFKCLTKVRERDFDGSWVERAKEDKEFEIYRDRKEFFEALEGK